MIRVRVSIKPEYHEVARKRGYNIDTFDAELLEGPPWMFWHRVKPLTGKHTAPIDLPPMFDIQRL